METNLIRDCLKFWIVYPQIEWLEFSYPRDWNGVEFKMQLDYPTFLPHFYPASFEDLNLIRHALATELLYWRRRLKRDGHLLCEIPINPERILLLEEAARLPNS